MSVLAAGIILLAGFAMAGFGLACMHRPERGAAFLGHFAQTLRAHLLEQMLRLLLGAALLMHAPAMAYPTVFTVFGWVLVLTSAGLLLLPWRWHQRFAQWAVPFAIRNLRLYAFGAALIGLALVAGVVLGAR